MVKILLVLALATLAYSMPKAGLDLGGLTGILIEDVLETVRGSGAAKAGVGGQLEKQAGVGERNGLNFRERLPGAERRQGLATRVSPAKGVFLVGSLKDKFGGAAGAAGALEAGQQIADGHSERVNGAHGVRNKRFLGMLPPAIKAIAGAIKGGINDRRSK